jgi:hypothetical protein
MKGWVIAVVIVVALVAAVAFYMLLSRGGRQVALLNAERLLISENFTGTYRLTESQLINTSLISEVLQINGVVTISRSPLVGAVVTNGTEFVIQGGENSSVYVESAIYKANSNICLVTKEMPSGSVISKCIPYSNYTKYTMLSYYMTESSLRNARYIGIGHWKGEATYCFASVITIKPPNETIAQSPAVEITVNVTKICILGNGVIANMTMTTYESTQEPTPTTIIFTINETLVNYSFTFNQRELDLLISNVTQG